MKAKIRKLINFFKKEKVSNATHLPPKKVEIEDVKGFVNKWNIDFPLDRWYRKKHKIPFNSQQHRDLSIIDMRFEWEEEKLFKEILETEDYKLDRGDFMRKDRFGDDKRTESEKIEEFKNEFKNIDLSQYDD